MLVLIYGGRPTSAQALTLVDPGYCLEDGNAGAISPSEIRFCLSGDLAKRTEQQAVSVEETSAALEEISTIIGVIYEIAFQTNLLALNELLATFKTGGHASAYGRRLVA